MERTNIEVYWSLCAQLWRATRDLPPGPPIGDVKIE
jgi:hypothetical protein